MLNITAGMVSNKLILFLSITTEIAGIYFLIFSQPVDTGCKNMSSDFQHFVKASNNFYN